MSIANDRYLAAHRAYVAMSTSADEMDDDVWSSIMSDIEAELDEAWELMTPEEQNAFSLGPEERYRRTEEQLLVTDIMYGPESDEALDVVADLCEVHAACAEDARFDLTFFKERHPWSSSLLAY